MASQAEADPKNIVLAQTLIQENLQQEMAAALDDYWTPERLMEAVPIGREAEPGAVAETLLEADWAAAGDAELGESDPAGRRTAGLELEGLPPRDYETIRVANRDAFPYSAIGKLFMTFDNVNYVGSAWVTGDSKILTAGHCVFDENVADGWADRVLFIPQFHQGNAPMGRFAVTRLHTLSGWAAGGADKFNYDMGAGHLDRSIQPDTGAIGWMANHPPDQGPYQAIGYPARYLSAAYPYDGQEMWRCNGIYLGGQNPVNMANNMTQGCSGGPRLTLQNGRIYANGLNSFRWTSEPESMNSPYFGQGFLNLLVAT